MIRSFRSCVGRQLFFGPTCDESKASEFWKPMIQNGRGFLCFFISRKSGDGGLVRLVCEFHIQLV